MSYSSAEKELIQRQYQGGLDVGRAANSNATERDHFIPGNRYHLLMSELDVKKEFGTAVEVGCSNGDCISFLGSRSNSNVSSGSTSRFPTGCSGRWAMSGSFRPIRTRGFLLKMIRSKCFAMIAIEHLFDPFHAFREIERVLAPAGQAFINLPLVTSIKNRFRRLHGRLPNTSVPFDRWFVDKVWDGNHLPSFTMDSIRRLCTLSGLELTRIARVGAHHRIKTLAPSFPANEVSFVVRRMGLKH